MWLEFDSRTRRHMWVEFVVGSRPCSERFFSGYTGFPLSSKTNISKFQFDLESEGHKFISLGLLRATLVKQRLFIYLSILLKIIRRHHLVLFEFVNRQEVPFTLRLDFLSRLVLCTLVAGHCSSNLQTYAKKYRFESLNERDVKITQLKEKKLKKLPGW